MTKEQLQKAKRQVRKKEIKKLTIVGKLAYYLGIISFRMKNVGYENEINWKRNMCVGVRYSYEVTQIYRGFHPMAIFGYILYAIAKGFVRMWEYLREMPMIEKNTKKVNYVDYYDKRNTEK